MLCEMKKFLAILVLVLISITPSQADDIRDFQIEGMSIGDSLLDYFDESEMIYPTSRYKDKTYKAVEIPSSQYDDIQIHVKSDDKKYTIHSIDGLIYFENNIKGCIKKKNEIVGEMLEVFKGLNKVVEDNWPMASDHGKLHFVRFKFESGDFTEVTCYEYNDSWDATNHLRIGITRIEVENWIIDKAFK